MNLDYQRHARTRLFQNNLLEFTSNIHPVIPFVVYGPFILAMMGWGLSTGLTTWAVIWWCIPVGWVVWDVTEYAMHRWFFHWEGSGPFTRKVHAIIHGYHHQYPDDPLRLVMPLGASIPLALVIGGALWLVDAPRFTIPGFAGFVAGYLFYDFTHWSTHARTPKTAWGKAVRAHHMAHHFAGPDKNFGISHRWIDALVGSLRRRERQSQESAGEAA